MQGLYTFLQIQFLAQVLLKANIVSRSSMACYLAQIHRKEMYGKLLVDRCWKMPSKVKGNSFQEKRGKNVFIYYLWTKILTGFNSTIFAYGAMGSGKTWSMNGRPNKIEDSHVSFPISFYFIFLFSS